MESRRVFFRGSFSNSQAEKWIIRGNGVLHMSACASCKLGTGIAPVFVLLNATKQAFRFLCEQKRDQEKSWPKFVVEFGPQWHLKANWVNGFPWLWASSWWTAYSAFDANILRCCPSHDGWNISTKFHFFHFSRELKSQVLVSTIFLFSPIREDEPIFTSAYFSDGAGKNHQLESHDPGNSAFSCPFWDGEFTVTAGSSPGSLWIHQAIWKL